MKEAFHKNPIQNNWITSEELKPLYELKSYISLTRIVVEYLIIALSIFLFYKIDNFWLYPLFVVIIGSRQHSLFVLLHDSAHGLICKNKFLNDLIGEMMGWSLFASMRGYRKHHIDHHVQSWLNTMKDPDFRRKQNADWAFPMKKTRFYGMIIKDLLGINFYDYITDAKTSKNVLTETPADKKWMLGRLTFSLIFIGLITYFSLWQTFFFFWFVPFITYLKFVFRFRSIVDHFALPNTHLYDRSRTITPGILERILIAPCSISIHNEHHTYARIPYYNLKKLHHKLMLHEDYQQAIQKKDSYLSVVLEDLTQKSYS